MLLRGKLVIQLGQFEARVQAQAYDVLLLTAYRVDREAIDMLFLAT